MKDLFAQVSEINIIICMLALNFVLIPNITFAQDNTNESVIQLVDNASKRSGTSDFSFYFKEKGGLVPVDSYVLFDSLSKKLVHGDLVNDSISEKMVQSGETKELRDAILIAKFFDLKSVYEGVGADTITYQLTVTDDGKSKTVFWNDASQVPETLNNVITEIKKLPH
jgi:hypothetical protein